MSETKWIKRWLRNLWKSLLKQRPLSLHAFQHMEKFGWQFLLEMQSRSCDIWVLRGFIEEISPWRRNGPWNFTLEEKFHLGGDDIFSCDSQKQRLLEALLGICEACCSQRQSLVPISSPRTLQQIVNNFFRFIIISHFSARVLLFVASSTASRQIWINHGTHLRTHVDWEAQRRQQKGNV